MLGIVEKLFDLLHSRVLLVRFGLFAVFTFFLLLVVPPAAGQLHWLLCAGLSALMTAACEKLADAVLAWRQRRQAATELVQKLDEEEAAIRYVLQACDENEKAVLRALIDLGRDHYDLDQLMHGLKLHKAEQRAPLLEAVRRLASRKLLTIFSETNYYSGEKRTISLTDEVFRYASERPEIVGSNVAPKLQLGPSSPRGRHRMPTPQSRSRDAKQPSEETR